MNPFDTWNAQDDVVDVNQWMKQQQAMRGMPANKKTAAVTKPAGKKKNFLVDQISTVGGIAGGIGGGILGAAAGGIGAVPGAAIGSGGGSALGEAIENAITGDSLGKNVAKEGALGVVFGAGPIRGAKFAAGAVKGLAQGGGKAAVRAASDEAAKFTVRGAVGNKLKGKAADLATKQFGLTDKFIADYTKRYGEDAGKTLTRYGIMTGDDAEKTIAKQQGIFNELVDGAGNIPKADVQKTLDKVVSSLSKKGPSADKSLGQKLQSETNQLLADYGDEIPAATVNKLRQQYDNLVTYTLKQSDPASYGMNKRVADALRGTLQKASGSPQLKETGMELSKLRNLSHEIQARAPKVESRGSSPLGFRNLLGAGIGGVVGGIGGGLPGAIAGAAAVSAINSPAGRRAATSAAIQGGDRLIQSGAKAAQGQMSAGGTALRIGGLNAIRGLQGGGGLEDAILQSQSGNELDTQTPNTMPDNMMSSGNMDTSYQNVSDLSSAYGNTEQQSQMPYSKENLMADINRDPRNAEKYIAYYQSLDEIFNPPAAKDTGPGYGKPTSQQYAQGMTGMNSVDMLEQMVGQNPGIVNKAATPGQGLPGVGGFISKAAGTNSYRGAGQNVLNSIARINTGANMPESERKFYEQTYLPQPGDPPETIRQKLATLRQFFSPIVNYQGGSGGGMEDAILQAQQQQGAYR